MLLYTDYLQIYFFILHVSPQFLTHQSNVLSLLHLKFPMDRGCYLSIPNLLILLHQPCSWTSNSSETRATYLGVILDLFFFFLYPHMPSISKFYCLYISIFQIQHLHGWVPFPTAPALLENYLNNLLINFSVYCILLYTNTSFIHSLPLPDLFLKALLCLKSEIKMS